MSDLKRRARAGLVVVLAALGAIAAKSTDWPATPGTVGYRLPWNRVTQDSIVDLLPGDFVDRFEFRGRLVDQEGRPVAGLLVYTYHADREGLYGSRAIPEITTMAGCVRSGPGGGFVVRTQVPGMYEGTPHIHFEASLPDRGRCTWFVSLNPDSATRTLPNSSNLRPGSYQREEHNEQFALVHLDPDGVYRTRQRTLHVEKWFSSPGLDSIHAKAARRFEIAPWRSLGPKSR